jgi:tetratricopeptide (TPR) repeat protein
MTRRAPRAKSTPAPPEAKARAAPLEQLPATFCAALASLAILATLVPFDTAAAQWNNVAAIMVWILLLGGWLLAGAARGKLTLRLDLPTLAALVLLALPALSGIVLIVSGSGDARLAMNLAWQWLAFGMLVFAARQWMQTPGDARALAAVFISVAAGLSVYAVAEYLIFKPELRAEYVAYPQRVLNDAGVRAGTTNHKHFEDRLASTEPTATFSLTNSLAGVLAPALVLVAGLLVAAVARGGFRDRALRYLVPLVLIAVVLVLTKSRTAMLATLGGIVLVCIYGTRLGKRVDGRIPLVLGLVAVLAIIGGAVSGALDVEVLSEAPKSVLYRFQYWQATSAMIADYPLLGVGPGNFQDTYQHYQLPEASENVADPHNFILEIWATAGTLAAVALALFVAALVWHVRRGLRASGEARDAATSSTLTAPPLAYLAAGVAGLLFGYGCGFLSGLMPDLRLLITGVPAAALVFWFLAPWIKAGELSPSIVIATLATAVVNLLAAGGISFPGVATWLWLLVAMLVLLTANAANTRTVELSRRGAYGLLALVALLGVLYHQTVYSPVLRSNAELSEGLVAFTNGQFEPASERYALAARLDPLSPQPWISQAAVRQVQLLRSEGSPSLRELFDAACVQAIRRDPRSAQMRQTLGNWRLEMYRAFGKASDLDAAVEDYRAAVERFPNNALLHAQLAWALHVAGRDAEAAEQAERALALDAAHEHQELKLAAQNLFDVTPAAGLAQVPGPKSLIAEPIMRDLRRSRDSDAGTEIAPPKIEEKS